MEKNNYHDALMQVLDSVFELEGLVQLALKKTDDKSVFPRLINTKLKLVNDYVAELNKIVESAPIAEAVSVEDICPEKENADEESTQTDLVDALEESIDADDAELEVRVGKIGYGDNDFPEDDNPVVEEFEEADVELEQDTAKEIDLQESTPKPIDRMAQMKQTFAGNDGVAKNSEIIADVLNAAHAVPGVGDVLKRKSTSAIQMFSQNDKFRYIRELFGGSAGAFKIAMESVDEMQSYSEAEEYFYKELLWNEENAIVGEFMTKISNYFEA